MARRYELRDAAGDLINTILLDNLDAWSIPEGHTLTLVPDPDPGPDDKRRARSQLAVIRYRHETAGIMVGGVRIATDRESQALITGAYTYSLLDPAAKVDWKGADGTWAQIDAAAIASVAAAVAAHVQFCFSRERTLVELIEAAETAEDLQGIDFEEGWPE